MSKRPYIQYISHETEWIPGLDSPPPIVKRGVFQTLRELRETPPGHISRSHFSWPKSAPEVQCSVQWMLEEFPEMAGEELPPPHDYFVIARLPGSLRWLEKSEVTKTRSLRAVAIMIAALAVAAVILLLLRNLQMGCLAETLILVGIAIIALLPNYVRQLNAFPRTPGAILQCTDRELWEELARTSLTPRDLYVGEIVRLFRRTAPPWFGMALTMIILLAAGVPLALSTGHIIPWMLGVLAAWSWLYLTARVIGGMTSGLVQGESFYPMMTEVRRRRLRDTRIWHRFIWELTLVDYSLRAVFAATLWFAPYLLISAGVILGNVWVIAEAREFLTLSLCSSIILCLGLASSRWFVGWFAKLNRRRARIHYLNFINYVADYRTLQMEVLNEGGDLKKLRTLT